MFRKNHTRAFLAILSTFAGVLVGVPQNAAWAESAGGALAPSDTPWANENEYHECGQTCMLKKSNEALSLDARYTYERIQQVDALTDGDDILRELGGFCAELESADACQQRYVTAATRALYESRNAIGKNEMSASSLYSDKGTVTAKPVTKKLKPQIPTVITWDRVKEKVKKDAKTPTMADWKRDATPRPPLLEDFYIFKEVPRDPSDPSSEKLTVVDTSEKGKKAQKEAFDKATAAYLERYGKFAVEWKSLEKSAKAVTVNPNAEPSGNQERAFQRARRSIIGAVNGKLEELKLVSKGESKSDSKTGTSGPNRSTASAKGSEKTPPKPPAKPLNATARVTEPSAPPSASSKDSDEPWDTSANDEVRKVDGSAERDTMVNPVWATDAIEKEATRLLKPKK